MGSPHPYWIGLDHADFLAINNELSCIDWNALFQYCFNVNECWESFLCAVKEICVKFVPLKSTTKPANVKYCKRYYPRYINDLRKSKLIAWKKWKLTKNTNDRIMYASAVASCSKAIKKFYAAKELELIRKNNISYFYNFVNKRMSNYSRIGDIRGPNGTLTDNDARKCTIFNEFFASVFTFDDGIACKCRLMPKSCLIYS